MELWNRAQAVNQMQQTAPLSQSNFKGEFILSGLLRCPVCNAGTVMSKSKKRDGFGLSPVLYVPELSCERKERMQLQLGK